jgi:L-aminopeptidase/D-esterase-like protein
MKGGIGTASIQLGDGLVVGAIVAVNALGDVVDPESGQIIAGARTRADGEYRLGAGPTFADTYHVMEEIAGRKVLHFYEAQNTVIGVVATNAILSKDQANKVAQMAQDGLALAVRPAHTMLDGDTLFCLATNQAQADVNIIGAFAARATAQAIVNAVRYAEPLGELPAASNL